MTKYLRDGENMIIAGAHVTADTPIERRQWPGGLPWHYEPIGGTIGRAVEREADWNREEAAQEMCAHPGANGGTCGLAPHDGDGHYFVHVIETDHERWPDEHVMTFDREAG